MNTPFLRQHAADHAADMIARFLGLSLDTAGRMTDLNEGSNIRSFFEAVALRFEYLDNKVFGALARAIPSVLYEFFGEGDGVSTFTGFPLLPALPATGVARFTLEAGYPSEVEIPFGFRLAVPSAGVSIPEKIYTVLEPLTIDPVIGYGETTVMAAVAGKAGNVAAGTMQLKDTAVGVATATNLTALVNGADQETEEGRRQRFAKYIANLARAQLAGLEVGACQAQVVVAGVVTERVLFARALNVPTKRGLVYIYIDNGGATASDDLVTAAQDIIDGGFDEDGNRVPGYAAAGIEAVVIAVEPLVVPVTVTITPSLGYVFADLEPLVEDAIGTLLLNLGYRDDLEVAGIVAAAMNVKGVEDVVVSAPTANVSVAEGERILPGTVTVNEA